MSARTRHYLLPGFLVLLLVLLAAALLTSYHQSRALKSERVYREFYTRALCEQVETYLKKTVILNFLILSPGKIDISYDPAFHFPSCFYILTMK